MAEQIMLQLSSCRIATPTFSLSDLTCGVMRFGYEHKKIRTFPMFSPCNPAWDLLFVNAYPQMRDLFSPLFVLAFDRGGVYPRVILGEGGDAAMRLSLWSVGREDLAAHTLTIDARGVWGKAIIQKHPRLVKQLFFLGLLLRFF